MKVRTSITRVLFLVALLAAACTRVPTYDRNAVYQIDVVNPLPYQVAVSLETGNGVTVLGPVDPAETKRFEIRPDWDRVKLLVTAQDKRHADWHKRVRLKPNEVARVTVAQD